MPAVFINYRGADDNFAATMIGSELTARFGRDQIFWAPESLRPGDDFRDEIERILPRCAALVAVIGRGWLAPSTAGRRGLDHPDDYVRWEIATALRLGLRVIPVLLGDTPIPEAGQLPADISALSSRNVIRVYANRASYDVRPLIDELARLPALAGVRTPESSAAPGRPAASSPAVATSTPAARGGVVFQAPTTIHGDVVAGDKHVWGGE
jgi:TIR domain